MRCVTTRMDYGYPVCQCSPEVFICDLEIHPHKNVNLHVAAIEDQMFDVMRQSDVTFTATGSKACGIMWGPARGFCKVSFNDLV